MTVENPIPQLLLQPITTTANSRMNQSEFLANAQSKGKLYAQGMIGLASRCLKNRWKIYKPITKWCNYNCVITFKSDLKTALNNEEGTDGHAMLMSNKDFQKPVFLTRFFQPL